MQEQGLAHPNFIDTRSVEQKDTNDPIISVRILG